MRKAWVADLVFTLGGVSIIAGCYWLSPAVALMLAGVALCGYGLLLGGRYDR